MTEQLTKSRLRFYLTEAQPCPYLPGRMERKIFTPLRGPHAPGLNDELSASGFRRSQNVAYRPQCIGCDACVSTRVLAQEFTPSRSDRRILKRNADLTRSVCEPMATEEQYQLFRRYLSERHADGAMAEMDAFDFASMIEDSTVRTRVLEYRDGNGDLVAACLTDVMRDGLSLVYSFFTPEREGDSLGIHIILDHIAYARQIGVKHVYMGYWVDGCRKMSYKVRFKPAQYLRAGVWRDAPRLEDEGVLDVF